MAIIYEPWTWGMKPPKGPMPDPCDRSPIWSKELGRWVYPLEEEWVKTWTAAAA